MYAFWLGKKPPLIYGRPCGKPRRERRLVSVPSGTQFPEKPRLFRGKGRGSFSPAQKFVAIPEAFALTVAGSVCFYLELDLVCLVYD